MRRSGKTIAALALAVLLGFPLAAMAAGNNLSAGIGFNYATGDYGTDKTTDSLTIPLEVDFSPTQRLGFELVIPYIYQNNSNTVFVNGMRFSTASTSRRMRPGFNLGQSQSGLGDITLTTRYALLPETATQPLVSTLLYLQFPTGDENKGLGTGELAAGPGLSVSKWFQQWNLYGETRYIFQGSNSDIGLKDYLTLDGEVAYAVNRFLLPSIALWYATAPSDDSSDLLEARLKIKYKISGDLLAQGYLLKGLSNSSADFGLGASISYSF
ncbi:MAG TPA: transporter [Desulfuromonadales bacterium]|nr:transporter [Desulfuromonadales bacterium]